MRYVFICGAVGSGNTFMFDCVTRDENTYGVNEDALGATLERLIQSEKEFGRCPHSVEAFLGFLDTLRGDRRTLVLKTPSNLRHRKLIQKYLSDARFLILVREPHAAIVSGIRRHSADKSIEEIAHIWLRDYQQAEPDEKSMIIPFENLICTPAETLEYVADMIFPVSRHVIQYAQQLASPQRATPAWWRSKVTKTTQAEIERCVQEFRLDEYYKELCSRSNLKNTTTGDERLVNIGPVRRGMDKLREWSVKGWYAVRH